MIQSPVFSSTMTWRATISQATIVAARTSGARCHQNGSWRRSDRQRACLGAERDRHDPIEECVGIRLEPHDFAEPGRLGRLDPGMSHSLAGRRLAERSALRHGFVAIRQARRGSRSVPQTVRVPRDAVSSVSWSPSSASWKDPSIR